MTLVLKDPAGALDYMVDWGAHYLTSDVLTESSWSVVPIEPGGLTVDSSQFDDEKTFVNVSGGQVGKIYRLLNQITTNFGREDSRSIVVRVETR
jgi:hypothetical protein